MENQYYPYWLVWNSQVKERPILEQQIQAMSEDAKPYFVETILDLVSGFSVVSHFTALENVHFPLEMIDTRLKNVRRHPKTLEQADWESNGSLSKQLEEENNNELLLLVLLPST